MKRIIISFSTAILLVACTVQPPDSLPKEESASSSVAEKKEQISSVPEQEKQTERTFTLESGTYGNETYGFSVHVPANAAVEERDGYTRLQNYSAEDDRYGLEPGEYYLEIHTPAESWGPCAEQIVNGTKVTVGGVSGFRGLGQEGGDAGGKRFALCLEAPGQYYYVQATENSDAGSIANAILDSFSFTR